MRTLSLKLLLLFLPFVMVLGYVEQRLRMLPNGYTRNKAALEKALPSVEILLVGSSHGQNGFTAEVFSRPAFNLAYGSQSLYYDAKLVDIFAPNAPKLRAVVFDVAYFSFESTLERSVESWRAGFYRQVYGIPPESGEGFSHLADRSYIALYSPRLAYQLVLDDLRGMGSRGIAGATTAVGGGEVSDSFAAQRIRFHQATMYPSTAAQNMRTLEATCHRLQARGITTVLVTTPVHRSYFEREDPKTAERMRLNARQIAESCGGFYLDLERDPRFERRDFVDSDHLNAEGAAKLSRVVDQVLAARIGQSR